MCIRDRFGSLPVALAPWGGDAGCSVAVPGDVLKKLGGAPVDCVAYALAAHSFPETYELAPCECECGAVGRVQLLTADDLAGVGSFAEGFGLHHVDARDRSAGDGKSVAEVEAAFYEHDAVFECSAFGLPDERLGETVGLAAMRKPGATTTEAELLAAVKAADKLAAFKIPAHIVLTTEPLPRGATGKILKREIRDALAARLGLVKPALAKL